MRLSRSQIAIFLSLLLLIGFSAVRAATGSGEAERAKFCNAMEAGLLNTHRISASGPDNTTLEVMFTRLTSGNRSWAADFFKIYGVEILNAGFVKIRFSTLDDAWDFPLK
jgi:hypothetical protein